MTKNLFLTVFVIVSFSGFAQIDYTRQYNNAKDLFKSGKYNLAMEAFKPLVAYDKNNKYPEYASFYYSLAAYKQGYKNLAKDGFNQLKTTYPKWDKMDEVNYWLANVHFDNGDYFQALKIFQSIGDKKMANDIALVEASHVSKVTDVETLRMMYEEYPKDEIIATALAKRLATNPGNEEDKKLLESVVGKFKLDRDKFFVEAPKTFYKDQYTVSLLLPFMVSSLEPSPGKKRNQIVLDFYEGMKIAVDTLAKQGVNINLRAYDTEHNTEKLKKLLKTDEMKATDLIVGPFFPEENKLVQDFSRENKINVVHPFSNNTEIIGSNPYAFLFQPSSETLGRKSAEYLASKSPRRKNFMVFYGPGKKDSVLAANFAQKAIELGLTVVASQRIAARETRKILEILATPTEFDEFKYPSEFTLKKDSLGGIYVASDDALIYSQVISGIETRKDSIKVAGSENWLADTAIDPEKYQLLSIALASPNYANHQKAWYQKFFKKFVKTYGRTPTSMAQMGYEFMLFFGNQLKTNGVFFQDGLARSGVLPGYLYEGFNYQGSRNNELVPFTTFYKGQLSLIEKR
jgi:TolA-binding protein